MFYYFNHVCIKSCRKTIKKNMNYLKIPKITAGVRANTGLDLKTTSLCLKHGLEREYRQHCRNMTGYNQLAVASVMFLQVFCSLSRKMKTEIEFRV
jgi:hypothetical protein